MGTFFQLTCIICAWQNKQRENFYLSIFRCNKLNCLMNISLQRAIFIINVCKCWGGVLGVGSKRSVWCKHCRYFVTVVQINCFSTNWINYWYSLALHLRKILWKDWFYFYYFLLFCVYEEDGKDVPGGQEHAAYVPVSAGFWFMAGKGSSLWKLQYVNKTKFLLTEVKVVCW